MKEYYLGLDIGTNSVGYAVTDTEYNLCKFKGEPMWGIHVFEEGNQCAERRGYRTARRRLDRKNQRVHLVQEIFAPEIAKVDERFFVRLKESALYREDTSGNDPFICFTDGNYTDCDYYKEYPTIHHLIVSLMDKNKVHDVRLVYMAAAWLVAHRGHFLNEVDKNHVEQVLDFDGVYNSFLAYFEENTLNMPWNCDVETFKSILLKKCGVKLKEEEFIKNIFGGKKPKDTEETVISTAAIIKLLSGGKIEVAKIFPKNEYEESSSISLKMSEEDFESKLAELEDEADFLIKLRSVYDWSLLYEAAGGNQLISKAKVAVYEQHKKDLKDLKDFVRKYLPDKYNDIFRKPTADNYVNYSYNFKSVNSSADIPKRKSKKEDFCSYINKIVKGISCDSEDQAFYDDMISRLETCSFMPKQVNDDNRVIPYQLYYYELKQILTAASSYLPFLNEKDEDGFSPIDKILSIMEFRIPYYVGPLHKENSSHAWLVRKANGRITPWNFAEKVDLDASEKEFIDRMTNSCTYLPGESVLPKNSLLYCRFEVLNEINNIKINGADIPVECKQGIYGLFEQYKKVSVSKIKDYLLSNNYMKKDDVLSGLDINVKSSLKSYHDFKRLLSSRALSKDDVEKIITQITYTEERSRIKKFVDNNFPQLSDEDKKYISKLKYSDFGRVSRKFLSEMKGVDKTTGEIKTIINTLWESNDNLMQIIFSKKYNFKEILEDEKKAYYRENGSDVEQLLDDMYISNAVKRPIYRTLDIVKDIKKACGCPPKKIFVEMARGGGEKGKRSVTRRSQIEEMYKNCDRNDVRELSKLLDSKTDNELQREVLFLYFMQMGRCLYSGKPIDIEKLNNDKYVNVDHIYPQAKVKDDSLNNKALVFSEINGQKGDKYPISQDIRTKMHPMWLSFKERNLISEEKFRRLTRSIPFSEEEKQGFINRQLVETRQSTKAVAEVLKTMFPDTEIVYVKAGLAADFKQEYKITKSRIINDLHHAKDAYLNIFCGNVYHSKFTSRFFDITEDYSIKTKTLYSKEVKVGDEIVWHGEDSIAMVKKVLAKNNIHYTRYAFCRKGGLFDQMPLKKSNGLIQRKAGLDTEKYGGYNKSTASFFMLTQYVEDGKKPKKEVMLVPVELMVADRVLADEQFAVSYIRGEIAEINNRTEDVITQIRFPLGLKPIKINTRFSFDGFESCIIKKGTGGAKLGFTSLTPLILENDKETYIKKLENFDKKRQKYPNYKIDETYDGICSNKNIDIYNQLETKINSKLFKKVFYSQIKVLADGKTIFEGLSLENQSLLLLSLLSVFKTGRTTGCDLSMIKGVKHAAVYENSSKLSNWKKNFNDVRIVYVSASGLFKSTSMNLMELL